MLVASNLLYGESKRRIYTLLLAVGNGCMDGGTSARQKVSITSYGFRGKYELWRAHTSYHKFLYK